MSFWSWLVSLFRGSTKPSTPPVTPPVVEYVPFMRPVGIFVGDPTNESRRYANVEVRLNISASAVSKGRTDTNGYFCWQEVSSDVESTHLLISADGFEPYDVVIELSHGSTATAHHIFCGIPPSSDPPPIVVAALTPTRPQWTIVQLMDMQGDLMIWCPELKPNFVNGVDPVTGIRERSDVGSTPHGIHNGWIWTVWIPFYPAEQRRIIYQKIKSYGYTHCALHVAQPLPDGGYHGLRPMSQAECDNWGTLCNTVYDELVAAGIIPVCAGPAPGDASTGGATLAKGFDASRVLVAMTDWDNTTWAAERIKYISDIFPNALLYYERPMNATKAQPDASPSGTDSTFPPTATNGGEWIRRMQQLCPRFVGVLYEVDYPTGVDACAAELTMAHRWWRDIQEVNFEVDTYWKFWDNLDINEARRFTDQLSAKCLFMKGCMSGGTTHAPIVTDPGTTTNLPYPGDMIPASSIIWEGGCDIGTFAQTSKLTKLSLQLNDIYVAFDKQDVWPQTCADGEKEPGLDMGPLQFSMGLILKINGQWYGSAPIELWKGLDHSGGQLQQQNIGDGRGQIQANWFYDNRWGALAGYQPKPGEEIGFFIAAGDCRNNYCPTKERTNIVKITLPPSGKPAVFQWNV